MLKLDGVKLLILTLPLRTPALLSAAVDSRCLATSNLCSYAKRRRVLEDAPSQEKTVERAKHVWA